VLSSRVYPEFFTLYPHERVLNAGFGHGPQVLVYKDTFQEMLGVDIQADRLNKAGEMLHEHDIQNVELAVGSVEALSAVNESFDAALAIDIAEHVERPEIFFSELYRVLKPGGRLLITFPAMHDRFEDFMHMLGRFLKPWKKRLPHIHNRAWHPDAHAHEYSFAIWQRMVERAGFTFIKSRATTMFPPLHLYGVPRFWFSVEWLHKLDKKVASSRMQYLGQTIMAEFKK